MPHDSDWGYDTRGITGPISIASGYRILHFPDCHFKFPDDYESLWAIVDFFIRDPEDMSKIEAVLRNPSDVLFLHHTPAHFRSWALNPRTAEKELELPLELRAFELGGGSDGYYNGTYLGEQQVNLSLSERRGTFGLSRVPPESFEGIFRVYDAIFHALPDDLGYMFKPKEFYLTKLEDAKKRARAKLAKEDSQ